MRRLIAGILVVGALVGCRKVNQRPQPKVTLVEPGTGDLNEIRIEAPEGAERDFVMTMRIRMRMDLPGAGRKDARLPEVRLSGSQTVAEVKGNGDRVVNIEFTGAEVDPDANPKMVKAMTRAYRDIVGLKGRMILSPRGAMRDFSFEFPDGVDPQLRQMMDSIMNGLSFSPVYPEEPVGVGAVWTVVMPVKTTAFTVDQEITYKVLEIDDEHVLLHADYVQSAKPQPLHMPGMMAAVKAELVSLHGEGNAELDIAFDDVMPRSASIDMQSDFKARADLGGGPTDFGASTEATIEIVE